MNPPYVNTKGAPYLNTFLVFIPVIGVGAAFTSDSLPAGITLWEGIQGALGLGQ